VVGEPDALLGTRQGQIARSGHTQLPHGRRPSSEFGEPNLT
jgi:hypothetical protein